MIEILSSFILSEKSTIISLAVTYWLSDLVEGYVFLHDGDSAVIRYMKGFRSDIEAGLLEFFIQMTVTFGGGLFLDSLIYPIVNTFFAANGQILIIVSAMLLFLSSIYERRTDSHPWAIALPRILGILVVFSSLHFLNSGILPSLEAVSGGNKANISNSSI